MSQKTFLQHSNVSISEGLYDYEGDFMEMWFKKSSRTIETFTGDIPEEFERFKKWVDAIGYGKFNNMSVTWLTDNEEIKKTNLTNGVTMIIFFGDDRVVDITREDNVTRKLKIKDGDILAGTFTQKYTYSIPKQKGKGIVMIF